MDAKERAELMAIKIIGLTMTCSSITPIVDLLTSQISEAERDAVMFERTVAGMTVNWKDGFDKGFSSAREKAAGIVEKHEKIHLSGSANAIRAMSPSVPGETK